jgi:SEL1 protein
MAKFLSGPPGGRTLPQTATRLSDLVGGVYGPGASAASSGHNALRPAIKAGLARAAGETWEDVVEYFLVILSRYCQIWLTPSWCLVQCRTWRD